MNKKIITLLGVCCLCLASLNIETKTPSQTKESQNSYLKNFLNALKTMLEDLRDTNIRNNPNWVANFKKDYKNPENSCYGTIKVLVDIYTDILKNSGGLLKEIGIKEEEARKYVEEEVDNLISEM